jgi:hypothetical protein
MKSIILSGVGGINPAMNTGPPKCARCGLPINPKQSNWWRQTTDGIDEVYHPTCYNETWPLQNDLRIRFLITPEDWEVNPHLTLPDAPEQPA